MIVPSILAADGKAFRESIAKVRGIAPCYQLDIADGIFVPVRSLQFPFTLPKAEYEAHLMVADPDAWVAQHAQEVDTIIAHVESCKDPMELMRHVHRLGKRFGLALRPETPAHVLLPYLEELDLALVFTASVIGRYGAEFDPASLSKITALRSAAPHLLIEVDGGMDEKTIRRAHAAGARRFVVGSLLQGSGSPKEAYQELAQEVQSL